MNYDCAFQIRFSVSILWIRRIILFAFLLLSLSPSIVAQQDPDNLDVSLFRKINDGRSPFLDDLVRTNNDIVFPLGVTIPVGFVIYGLLSESEYETNTGVLLTVSEVLAGGLVFGLKQVVRRDRPYASLQNVHLVGGHPWDPYSFPSAHSATAFALATTLSLRYPKAYVAIPVHLWALFVGYGRIYLGVHYPSDVLVGGAIGSGTALAVHLLEEKILSLKKKILGGAKEDSVRERLSVLFYPVDGGGLVRIDYRF